MSEQRNEEREAAAQREADGQREASEQRDRADAAAHPFGKPLDPALLAEPVPEPPRAFPTAVVAAIAIPLAALASSALLQRWLDGPLPAGDATGRWQLWGALIGAPFGLVCGLGLSRGTPRRALWILWGLLSPLLLPALVTGAVRAALPLRELVAERQAATCRETRKICAAQEFRGLCAQAAAAANARALVEAQLGPATQSLCDSSGCTYRWLYTGPWTPATWVASGSLICSLVVDGQGRGLRSAIGLGTEQP